MPAGVGAFQLDHDKVRLWIDGEQVDGSTTVLPIAEILGEHVEIVAQHVDLDPQ